MTAANVLVPDPSLTPRRAVVETFFTAARQGNFDALVAVLDPHVVLRVDAGARRPSASIVIRSADDVARNATLFALPNAKLYSVPVNGAAGVVITLGERPLAV